MNMCNLFSSDMLTWCASNYHRYIQMLGQPYWCRWTIKVCGTWGLQFGKDSILGSSYISGFGMLSIVFILNTIFLLMYCFVVKPLDIILSIIMVSFSSHEGLTTIENLRKKRWREFLKCLAILCKFEEDLEWNFHCSYIHIYLWIHFVVEHIKSKSTHTHINTFV